MTSEENNQNLASFFGWMATVLSFFFFASPFPSMKQLCIDRKHEKVSETIFITCILQAVWWMVYGFDTNATTVWFCNICAILSCAAYLTVFYFIKYDEKMRYIQCGKYFGGFILMGIIISFFPPALVGSGGTILSCGLALSTTQKIGIIMKTKDFSYIPINTSVAIFLCNISWVLFAAFAHDIFVAIPNLFGMVIQGIMITLYTYLKYIHGQPIPLNGEETPALYTAPIIPGLELNENTFKNNPEQSDSDFAVSPLKSKKPNTHDYKV